MMDKGIKRYCVNPSAHSLILKYDIQSVCFSQHDLDWDQGRKHDKKTMECTISRRPTDRQRMKFKQSFKYPIYVIPNTKLI